MALEDIIRRTRHPVTAFANDPISTEMGDHWAETDLEDYFGQKGFGGDSVLGVSERSNLDYTPQWTSSSRNFAEPLDIDTGYERIEPKYTSETPIDDGKCEEGYHPDPETGECVQDTGGKCEAGYHPDPETGECVQDTGNNNNNGTDPEWLSEAISQYPGRWQRPAGADAPYPAVPRYTAPGRPDLPDFSYEKYEGIDPFQAPSLEEARRDPGFEFRMQEGQRALESSAASKGMLRSGQTWKELQKYGQQMGELGYQNVYNRQLGEWDRSARQNVLDYQQGYGVARDISDRARRNVFDEYRFEREAAMDEFAPQMTAWPYQYQMAGRDRDQEYDRSWEEYLHEKGRFDEARDLKSSTLAGLMGMGAG
jgi:hypothetical protein